MTEAFYSEPADDEVVRAVLDGRVPELLAEYEWTADDVIARVRDIQRRLTASLPGTADDGDN
jgi:hypothetical protein